MFSFTNGSVFDLASVDLAEYSTGFQAPLTVHFVGYRQDGSTVTTDFTTDGVIDGTGPLADFQTFHFGPEFSGLIRVEIPNWGWSLDNLVVYPFQPSTAIESVRFGPPTNFPPQGQNQSSAIVAGHFNGDGPLDLAVLGGDGVSLLPGLGNGAFGAASSFPLSGSGGTMAVGDFNKDGKLDLVVVERTNAYILLGDGAGNFATFTNLAGYANYSVAVAVADFNGDGYADLAIATPGAFRITVAFGNGDGSFAPPTNYQLTDPPADLRAGDLNRDGKPELIASLQNSFTYTSNLVCVLRNKGNGTFYPPDYYRGTTNDIHDALELADFVSDGNLHVAVLNRYSDSVTILTNSGGGLLASANEYALGFSPVSIAAGDFNGDGRPDLLVSCSYSPATSLDTGARILLGRGRGLFSLDAELTAGTYPGGPATIAVGDYNGDGKPDIALILGSAVVVLNETLPTLDIAPVGLYNQITWSTMLGNGFTLQYTANPADPGSWQAFSSAPVSFGYWSGIADWADGTGKFYRLKKP